MVSKWLSRIIGFFILLLIFAPLWSYLWWYLSPNHPVQVTIIDKTVPNAEYLEHKAFHWILHYQRVTRPQDDAFYSFETDYWGFDPSDHPKAKWRDWDFYTEAQLDSIANHTDLLYIADTYGVYYNEWILKKYQTEHSPLIYGGMRRNELQVLERVVAQDKPVYAEFNTFASPTQGYVRTRAQQLLNVAWTGWTGRYFDELDTAKNEELPRWLVQGYIRQHGGEWPFEGKGLVFVNESNRIEVLDPDFGLVANAMPSLEVSEDFAAQYGTVEQIDYPYWFEVTYPRDLTDAVSMGRFSINTTSRGDSLFKSMGISKTFPAIIKSRHGKTWYFCADFTDNIVPYGASHFKKIHWVRGLLYSNAALDRQRFFWEFYNPMVTTILREQDILPS